VGLQGTWECVIVATIVLENGTHIRQRKVSHPFPFHMKQKIDILITNNHSQTLMDVVISNPTR
jgi:hypothetical protein